MPSIDLICCTRTWLSDNITENMLTIDKFLLIRNDRSYKRGDGTCIFINDRLDFEIPNDNWNDPDIEIQSTLLLGNNENKNCKKICVVVVYRPPSGNSGRACDNLKNYILSIPDIGKYEIITLGDFNWDFGNKHDIGYKMINEVSSELGLEQLIDIPTR